MKYNCIYCSKEFSPKIRYFNPKFCSKKCQNNFHYYNNKGKRCHRCWKELDNDKSIVYCRKCEEKIKIYQKATRDKYREHYKNYMRKYIKKHIEMGLCIRCTQKAEKGQQCLYHYNKLKQIQKNKKDVLSI